jgi:hypothetical protein
MDGARHFGGEENELAAANALSRRGEGFARTRFSHFSLPLSA